MKTQGLCWV